MGGAKAADPATDANDKTASSEVTLEAGALSFPRVDGLAENAKLNRARTLLQTLRAPGGDAFGGKIKGGVDVAATLKSYYRALEVAPLALAAGGADAVMKFVEGLDVPADIRPLIALAAGDVPFAGPLGTNAAWERDSNPNAFYGEWRRTSDPDALRITDATVKAFFGRWGFHDLRSVVQRGNPQFQLGAFKLFARAKELGLKVNIDHAAAHANNLPATASSAVVFTRFALAFGLDPATLRLGNRPLTEWQTQIRGTPLGNVRDFEQDSDAWYRAVEHGEARAFHVTDQTLELLLSDGYTDLSHWLAGPAETHLEALKGFERLAMFGAVEKGSIEDACANLEGHKDIAAAVVRIGKACGVSLDHVMLGDKSVAEWTQRKAPAGAGGVKKPLGAVRTWENDRNYNQLYAIARQTPRQAMSISDATLQKWFGAWGPNQNLTDYAGDGAADTLLAYVLWWARGKELGLPARCEREQLRAFAESMPATADAAHALRRLGRAFGFSVEDLRVGDKKVSSFARARSYPGAEPTLPARPPLGDTKMLKADLQSAMSKKDAALFSIDDASLKRLLAFDADLTGALGASRDRAWRIGVLSLAERALALSALDASAAQALVRSVPLAMVDDAATSELVATLVVKAGLSVEETSFSGGEPLSASEATAAHAQHLLRVLEGVDAPVQPRRGTPLKIAAGPLGNRPGPHNNYWVRRDPTMFELSDAAIRDEMMDWGEMSWLNHWQNAPGVISLVARIIELNASDGRRDCPAQQDASAWLAEPIPAVFGTADALPRVLRLCKAARVDPKDVVVEHKGGTVPLLKHPETVKLSAVDRLDAPARTQALADDLSMLSPHAKTRGANGGPAHPAEREAAVLHLLGVTNVDAPILHELQEILAAALQAMNAGELQRIDVRRLPAKHRDAMLPTAFQTHEHPAAVALLAGLLFDVDAASVEKVLLGQHHLPEVAKEMGALAAQLAKASPSALAFCALGLGADPPELTSLPLRAWMLTKPEPAAVLAKIKAEPDRAPALCAMVLEQALLADTPAARRTALRDVVSTAEKQGLVERAQMIDLLSDAAKRALDGDAIADVQARVGALLSARTDEDARAARTELAAALAQPTWTQDPNVLAQAALEAAAAIDLQFVAPLGAVDVKGGGVVGKAWESRLADSLVKKGAKVDVAGVKLPVESESGRAPRVSVSAYPAPDGSIAEKALALVAARWLTQRPFSIDDADGAAAVRAIAERTGASLTDVVVTPHTPLEALLGPHGAVSAALARGVVVHLSLRGDEWPAGFAAALTEAHGGKARLIATGPPVPGLPVQRLPPLDADAIQAHGVARGLGDDPASLLAAVITMLRERGVRVPLELVDRVAARLRLIDDDSSYTNLQLAILQTASVFLPASKRADLADVLRRQIGASDDDAELRIERRTAYLGDVPLKIVAPGVKADDLPALSAAERAALRAAGWALEVKEPVVGAAQQIEELGVAYGTMTGRDVHVHQLYSASKPSDVLSKSVGDVVIVAHGFAAAPIATQTALLEAAREGRVRLLIEDARGLAVADAFSLTSAGGGAVGGPNAAAGADDVAVRARQKGRALGLPDAVSDGVASVIEGITRDITSGELAPLVGAPVEGELSNLMELLAELMRVMPLEDAFVSAVSATIPMQSREQQDKLEEDARAVVTG